MSCPGSDSKKQKKEGSESCGTAVVAALEVSKSDASGCIVALEAVITKYCVDDVKSWRRAGKHPNTLIHELVSKKYGGPVVDWLVTTYKFDINAHRTSDLCTPLHLAAWTENDAVVGLLLRLGANPALKNKYGEDSAELVAAVKKKENMVWLDLELTHLPKDGPSENSILECAVVITDKDLNEVRKASWVVHHEEKEMKALSAWHQETFKSKEQGGNGLLVAVSESTTSKEAMEEELMALLTQHCPKEMCRLAGSSVHCDREVLLHAMPRVYNWLSHQVIDVSTLVNLVNIWLPETASQIPPSEAYNHRAEDDIQSSIELMKWLRNNVLSSK